MYSITIAYKTIRSNMERDSIIVSRTNANWDTLYYMFLMLEESERVVEFQVRDMNGNIIIAEDFRWKFKKWVNIITYRWENDDREDCFSQKGQ